MVYCGHLWFVIIIINIKKTTSSAILGSWVNYICRPWRRVTITIRLTSSLSVQIRRITQKSFCLTFSLCLYCLLLSFSLTLSLSLSPTYTLSLYQTLSPHSTTNFRVAQTLYASPWQRPGTLHELDSSAKTSIRPGNDIIHNKLVQRLQGPEIVCNTIRSLKSN